MNTIYSLHQPFIISSRLKPAVKIGETTISMDVLRWHPHRERWQYEYFIEGSEFMHYGCDIFGSGNENKPKLEKAFVTLLHFLSACAEAYNYKQATNRTSENYDLFPTFIAEWAQQHSDEITLLAYEIEGEA